MGFMLLVLIVGAVVRWWIVRERLNELDERIVALGRLTAFGEVDSLRVRLERLEREVARLSPAGEPAVEASAAEVPATTKETESAQPDQPAIAAMEVFEPATPPDEVSSSQTVVQLTTEQEAPEPVLMQSEPSWSDRLRAAQDQEWESLVGGNILNKLGALVLVIGIALFLGYSFRQMDAGGRAMTAAAVSVSLLGAGVLTERRAGYRAFALGLVGAGWAALYATAYAMYALPATRVIENPVAGSAVMVAVAVAMIAHSLAYRSQAATATAYFAAFAALAVTPSTRFAVISLIPLAASLLYLAQRFAWHRTAVFGLLATYGTCIARGSSDATLVSTQLLLVAYWVIFEMFDLLRVHRRLTGGGLDWIFPLNAAGFLWLSHAAWSKHAPDDLWGMAVLGAALYLTSAVVRGFLRPPSSFAEEDDLVRRLAYGSFEASLVLSALLSGMAVVARVPGVWVSAALALEAELLYLAGVRLKLGFVRQLGARALVIPVIRLLIFEVPSSDWSTVLGITVRNWTPPALLHVLLFYVNRAIPPARSWFGYTAAALLALVVCVELPPRFVGSAILAIAVALLELGVRRRLADFRRQGYALAIASAIATGVVQLRTVPNHPWLGLAISLAVAYAYSLRARRIAVDVMVQPERQWLALGLAAGTSGLAAALLWRTVPNEWLGLAWCALAVVLFELGTRRLPVELKRFWGLAAGLGAWAVPLTQADDFAKFATTHVWGSYFGAAAVAWYLTARISIRGELEPQAGAIRNTLAVAGTVFFLGALWLVLPDPAVTPAWTAAGIAWIALGFRTRIESFRWLGNAVTSFAAVRLVAVDVPDETAWLGLSLRLLIAGPIVASWYLLARVFRLDGTAERERLWNRLYLRAAAAVIAILIYVEAAPHVYAAGWAVFVLLLVATGRRFGSPELRGQAYCLAALSFLAAAALTLLPPASIGELESWLVPSCVIAAFYAVQFLTPTRQVAAGFSMLATVLLTALLYRQTSGSLLTVVWGIEGVALLSSGFLVRERMFRLQGLAVLLICILKLFLYDLRNLETTYRILSFVGLGVILLGVSWIYTRFRESLRRYL